MDSIKKLKKKNVNVPNVNVPNVNDVVANVWV